LAVKFRPKSKQVLGMLAGASATITGGRKMASEEVLRNARSVARKHVRPWTNAAVAKDVERGAVEQRLI
jgi:hypothetical protein